jgi:methionine sulfoxide reductase heme-binding subunit
VSDLLDDPQLTWFLSRATGITALALMTLSMVLGIGASTRLSSTRWPRFVTQGLHRNISLFVLVLTAVHVLVIILDDYVVIGLPESLVPFIGDYRWFWTGLGTLSSDLMIAAIVTSLLRQRIGYETWRAVHWTSYLCWPLGLVHSLGTGSDTRKDWMIWFVLANVALVLLAVAWRIVDGWPRRAVLRVGAVLVTACAIAVVFSWAKQGPFAPDWSKRSGTTQSSGAK